VPSADRDIRVRTVRIATGAHLLSFVDGNPSRPVLAEALDRVPWNADLLVNVAGLDEHDALSVIAAMSASARVRQSRRKAIVVCGQPSVRSLFELSGLNHRLLIEESVDDALRHLSEADGWLPG
jgi:anti-anti-sigma regulatory factor